MGQEHFKSKSDFQKRQIDEKRSNNDFQSTTKSTTVTHNVELQVTHPGQII